MSGKTAKLNRKELRPHRLPTITQSQLDALVTGKNSNLTSEVVINHNRRIIRLSKSSGLKLADAIEKHCKDLKIAPKPKS